MKIFSLENKNEFSAIKKNKKLLMKYYQQLV